MDRGRRTDTVGGGSMDLTHLQITCSEAARAANRPEEINTTAASSGKWPGPAATRLHARGRVVIIRDLDRGHAICPPAGASCVRGTGGWIHERRARPLHDTDRRESCPGAIARLHCLLLTSHRQVAGAPHESTRPSTLQLYPSGERAVPAAATGSLFRSRGSELFDVHMTCTKEHIVAQNILSCRWDKRDFFCAIYISWLTL